MRGDFDHQRIDFVDADRIAGPAVGGESAGAESDDTHLLRDAFHAGHDRHAHAGLHAVIRGRLETEVSAEHLRAVIDHAMVELALVVEVLRIAFVLDTELPVEIAGGEEVSLESVANDDADTSDEAAQGDEYHGLEHLPADFVEGEEDDNAGGKDDRNRQFVVGVEEIWSDEADEEAAHGPADGDHHVVSREMAGIGLEAGELTVADHADDEERAEEKGDDARHVEVVSEGPENIGHAGERGGEESEVDGPPVKPLRFKAKHEAEEVKDERHDPQEGDGGNVLREVLRDGEQEDGGAGGERHPDAGLAPIGRRGWGFAFAFGGRLW